MLKTESVQVAVGLVLFGLAIEKSNTEADLMKIKLPVPGSDNYFVLTQIRNRGERRFQVSDANRKQGRHVEHII